MLSHHVTNIDGPVGRLLPRWGGRDGREGCLLLGKHHKGVCARADKEEKLRDGWVHQRCLLGNQGP